MSFFETYKFFRLYGNPRAVAFAKAFCLTGGCKVRINP
jgi:hypothetical protein